MEGWVESDDWAARARRLGPLRYADLGPRRLTPSAARDLPGLAAWIAAATDRWWTAAGRPDPYTLVVLSGDDGHLARAVLRADLACAPALRYVMVDPAHASRPGPPPGLGRLVDLEEPAYLYPVAPSPAAPGLGTETGTGPGSAAYTVDDDLDGFERPAARGIGPMATLLGEVPVLGERSGAIVALDALSRMPYELYEQRDGVWCEIRVAAQGDGLVELAVPGGRPAPSPTADAENTRWRRLTGAADWLRVQLPTAEAGVLAVVDDWGGPGDNESLDLGQLRHVREPLDAAPQPVEGTSRSVVTWRLG